eukprot:TRINITY_DN10489_c0_g1_i1.p1 TRINITY_DN10489_c0_g1~~TRINITY_DN10489_c0_g1_i1.p1  ORF type:complete len:827 (+),score=153.92 TRINITY_DN10489_c0_g1_i1:273-2483(+)
MVEDCVSYNPLAFIPLLEPFVTFLDEQMFVDRGRMEGFWEKVMVNIFAFQAAVLCNPNYSQSFKRLSENRRKKVADVNFFKEEIIEEGQRFIMRHYSIPKVIEILKVLLARFLRLQPFLLEMWEDDPEGVLQEEIGDAYEQRVGPASEYLLHRLLRFPLDSKKFHREDYTEAVLKFLLSTLRELAQQPNPTLEMTLLKDACLYAYGTGVNSFSQLKSHDFCEVFQSDLLPEVSRSYSPPHDKIIKRRVAHVLQLWVDEIDSTLEKDAIRVCLYCLQHKDLLVRVFGAVALRDIISTVYQLRKNRHSEFIKPAIDAIVVLTRDMTSPTTTGHILDIISVIVEAMGELARPHLDGIMDSIQQLWAASQDAQVILQRIVSLLAAILKAMAGVSHQFEDRLFQVLEVCLNPQSQLDLLEQGIGLWESMVQRSVYMSPRLFQLFSLLPEIIRNNRDDSRVMDEIVTLLFAYFFTGKDRFLNTFSKEFASCMALTFPVIRSHSLYSYIDLVSFIIQKHPLKGPLLLAESLQLIFAKFISRHEQKHYDRTFHAIVYILCRLAIHSRDAFFAFMDELSKDGGHPAFLVWLEVTVKHLHPKETIFFVYDVTIVAALASFLYTREQSILSYAPQIVSATAAICKNYRSKKSERSSSRRLYKYQNVLIYNSPAWNELDELLKLDPMGSSNPEDSLILNLNGLKEMNGEQAQVSVLGAVSDKVMKFLRAALERHSERSKRGQDDDLEY